MGDGTDLDTEQFFVATMVIIKALTADRGGQRRLGNKLSAVLIVDRPNIS